MAQWHVMLSDRILHRFWVEEGKKVKIGRGKDTDVSLDNTAVSRHHATLEMRNGLSNSSLLLASALIDSVVCLIALLTAVSISLGKALTLSAPFPSELPNSKSLL
jgi:hypothetical protein